jgi:sugar lactone lactonase YvrE
VWSAQPVYGRIVRYDPDGGIDRIISLPVSRGTSCTFGGPDHRTLFITSATETLTKAQIAEEPLAGASSRASLGSGASPRPYSLAERLG